MMKFYERDVKTGHFVKELDKFKRGFSDFKNLVEDYLEGIEKLSLDESYEWRGRELYDKENGELILDKKIGTNPSFHENPFNQEYLTNFELFELGRYQLEKQLKKFHKIKFSDLYQIRGLEKLRTLNGADRHSFAEYIKTYPWIRVNISNGPKNVPYLSFERGEDR